MKVAQINDANIKAIAALNAYNEIFCEVESALISDCRHAYADHIQKSDILRIALVCSDAMYEIFRKVFVKANEIQKPDYIRERERTAEVLQMFKDYFIEQKVHSLVSSGEDPKLAETIAEHGWKTMCIIKGINDTTKRLSEQTD